MIVEENTYTKYQIYFFEPIENKFAILDINSIVNVDFMKNKIEVNYTDNFFNYIINDFLSKSLDITILFYNNNIIYKQTEFNSIIRNDFSKLILEHDNITEIGGMMIRIDPSYIKMTKTYLSEKLIWCRNNKIDLLL